MHSADLWAVQWVALGITEMTNARFRTGVASVCLVLAGCGGGNSGGSSGGGGGSTVNIPPSFTSPSAVSFVESRTVTDDRAVVQLTANDPDSSSLVFSFVAGKDAALFSFVNGPGRIAFNQAPSFETPRDADGDNVYEVDVSVSDGLATTRQTIRVTITNSREGLVVSQVVTLANTLQGSLVFLDDSNELLVVGDRGRINRVNAATGAVVSTRQIALLPSEQVLDIASLSLTFANGNFYALVKDDATLRLLATNVDTGARTVLWSQALGATVSGSLGYRGSQLLLALGDGGNRDAAQDRDDFRGNILAMGDETSLRDPSTYVVSPLTLGWGLRSPRLSISTNLTSWPIDRGETFNELNQADFPISQADANFEWPIRDAFADVGFSGTVTGTLVAPRIAQEIGVSDAGRWLDAADSLQGEGWFGTVVICDDRGNIWTWDRNNDRPIEKRNLDFGRTPSTNNAIVSMDDGDFDIGRAFPIFMLQANGVVLMADLDS